MTWLKYTGDGTTFISGFPADPKNPWVEVTAAEAKRLVSAGIYVEDTPPDGHKTEGERLRDEEEAAGQKAKEAADAEADKERMRAQRSGPRPARAEPAATKGETVAAKESNTPRDGKPD